MALLMTYHGIICLHSFRCRRSILFFSLQTQHFFFRRILFDADAALWAASAFCFAGFFHLGELLPSSEKQLTLNSNGIKWGDVAVDDLRNPAMVKVHLRVSTL